MQGQAGRWSAASDTLEARAAQVVVLQKGGQACPDWSYTDVTDSELATLCAGILAGRPQCVTEGGELLQINLESSPALTDAGVRSLLYRRCRSASCAGSSCTAALLCPMQ